MFLTELLLLAFNKFYIGTNHNTEPFPTTKNIKIEALKNYSWKCIEIYKMFVYAVKLFIHPTLYVGVKLFTSATHLILKTILKLMLTFSYKYLKINLPKMHGWNAKY